MSCISEIFKNSGEFNRLQQAKGAKGALGAADAVKAPLIHSLMQEGGKALVIMGDEASAVRMCENLGALQDGVVLYPSREFTFEQVAGVSHEFEHIRLGALSKILAGEFTAVVCSVNAACQFTMPPQELKKRTLKIKQGDTVSLSELAEKLVLRVTAVMTRWTAFPSLHCEAVLRIFSLQETVSPSELNFGEILWIHSPLLTP